jgi:hypothetical protein
MRHLQWPLKSVRHSVVAVVVGLMSSGGCAGYQGFYVSTDTITTAEDVPGGSNIRRTYSQWPGAGPNVSRVSPTESNYYHVKLPGFNRAKAQQKGKDYCWAACAQMILKFKGETVTQESIVEKIKGKAREDKRGGTALDIMNSLSGPWRQVSYTNGNGTWIVMDLARNWPVIIGLTTDNPDLGHACIVTGAWVSWYGPPGQAKAVIHKLEVFDPAPGAGNQSLSGESLKDRILFSVHFQSIY